LASGRLASDPRLVEGDVLRLPGCYVYVERLTRMIELEDLHPFEADHEHSWSYVFLSKRGCSPIACRTCGATLTDAQAAQLFDGGDPLSGEETVELSREEILRLLQDELQL